MILKLTQQDADANNSNEYFDALRGKNYDASFEGVKTFINDNEQRFDQRRPKRTLRRWQWAAAFLLPVLLILACTKTEHSQPVGQTITFSVMEKDEAARQELEKPVGGSQTAVSQEGQQAGYVSYTCFIPAANDNPGDAFVARLKAVRGITGLTVKTVNAQVKQSLLSQLGAKIFNTHIDANALPDAEVQKALMRQLKEQGFNDISVTVTRDKNGVRNLELHPGTTGPNISIDVSRDDKGTRMILKEEKGTIAKNPPAIAKPDPDYANMTDAEIRDHVRSRYGKQLRDADIRITRSAKEIAINIQLSDNKTEVIRFTLR